MEGKMSHKISAREFLIHDLCFQALFLLFIFLAGSLSQAAAPIQAAHSANENRIEPAVPMTPGGNVMALAGYCAVRFAHDVFSSPGQSGRLALV